jgi:hypothetical protein
MLPFCNSQHIKIRCVCTAVDVHTLNYMRVDHGKIQYHIFLVFCFSLTKFYSILIQNKDFDDILEHQFFTYMIVKQDPKQIKVTNRPRRVFFQDYV